MTGEDEEFVREVAFIMIVWTIVVVAGLLLVAFRDPFATAFAFSVPWA